MRPVRVESSSPDHRPRGAGPTPYQTRQGVLHDGAYKRTGSNLCFCKENPHGPLNRGSMRTALLCRTMCAQQDVFGRAREQATKIYLLDRRSGATSPCERHDVHFSRVSRGTTRESLTYSRASHNHLMPECCGAYAQRASRVRRACTRWSAWRCIRSRSWWPARWFVTQPRPHISPRYPVTCRIPSRDR